MDTRNVTAILARVSTEGQASDDATSLDTQESYCRNEAIRLRLQVDERYVLKVVESASEPGYHPQLEGLFAAARRGEFGHLIMDVLDRTTRAGQADFTDITQRFLREGITLHWARNPDIDLSTEDGQLMANIAAWRAYHDKATIVRRFTDGKEGRLRQGKPLRAYINYGYRWVETIDPATNERARDHYGHLIHDRYEPDPATAWVMRHIYRWLEEGGSAFALAPWLNSHEPPIPTPSQVKGRKYKVLNGEAPSAWTASSIQCLVSNPIYMGKREHKRYHVRPRTPDERREYKERTGHEYRSRRKVERLRPAECVLANCVTEALVSAETWYKANAQLALNNQFGTRGAIHYTVEDVLLGGGYVRCAYCGYAMTPTRRRATQPTDTRTWEYHCMRQPHKGAGPHRCPGVNITVRELDTFVWKEACRLIRDRDYLQRAAERGAEAWSPEAQIAHYAALIEDVRRREKANARQSETVDPDDPDLADFQAQLTARAKELAQERKQHEAKLAEAEHERDRRADRATRLERFADWAETHRDDLDDLTADERRRRILDLNPRVSIARKGDPREPRVDLMFWIMSDPHKAWHPSDWPTFNLYLAEDDHRVVSWAPNDPAVREDDIDWAAIPPLEDEPDDVQIAKSTLRSP